MPKCLPLWQNNSQKGHFMPDFLISSGKNEADFPYLFQKLRFRISHLLLEGVKFPTSFVPVTQRKVQKVSGLRFGSHGICFNLYMHAMFESLLHFH